MKLCEYFIIISILTRSNAFYLPFLDMFEKSIASSIFTDCTSGKVLTRTDYENLKASAVAKMEYVYLIHHVGGKKIKYSLTKAATEIPASTAYDKTKPINIEIHGYFGKVWPLSSAYQEIIDSLIKLNNSNVFELDYGALMVDHYYVCSTMARFVGETLGEVLARLYFSGITNFHLIGHSLGAHASGFAGKIFQNMTGRNLNRISGLDPAGPCFFIEPPERRLNPNDADFVDVIHTDISSFGINKSIGHVDFYPDGGENMPSCFLAVCSHMLTPMYYAESVNNNNFLAVPCSDWKTFKSGACSNNVQVAMGHWTPTTTRGNYYLTTNWFRKYAKGAAGTLKPWI